MSALFIALLRIEQLEARIRQLEAGRDASDAPGPFTDRDLELLAGCSDDYWARHGSEARALASLVHEMRRQQDTAA